jgi:hypothetical protein
MAAQTANRRSRPSRLRPLAIRRSGANLRAYGVLGDGPDMLCRMLIVALTLPADAVLSYRVGEDRRPHRRPATKTIPPGCGGFPGPRPFGRSLQAANAQQLSRGILHAWTQRTPLCSRSGTLSRSLRRATTHWLGDPGENVAGAHLPTATQYTDGRLAPVSLSRVRWTVQWLLNALPLGGRMEPPLGLQVGTPGPAVCDPLSTVGSATPACTHGPGFAAAGRASSRDDQYMSMAPNEPTGVREAVLMLMLASLKWVPFAHTPPVTCSSSEAVSSRISAFSVVFIMVSLMSGGTSRHDAETFAQGITCDAGHRFIDFGAACFASVIDADDFAQMFGGDARSAEP